MTILKQCGAPERALRAIREATADKKPFLSKSPEQYASVARGLIDKLGSGFLVALIGERGTGKTLMSVGVMGEHANEGRTVLYSTLTNFLMQIKATYNKESASTELDVMESFRKPDLLVLDEMGRRADTDWEDRLLFELLDGRYQDMNDTLLLSNQSPEVFEQAVGPSLSSRMKETGGIIICNWPSFRATS